MKNIWKRSWFVLSMILLFILTPLTFDLNSADISISAAFAKNGNGGGNGNGNGGGNGGGNGNSDGHGGGNSAGHGHSADATGEAAHGHSHAAGVGHQKQGYTEDVSSAKSKSVSASQLGRLNAAHASPNARAHAAPNSAVGRIAAYEAAVYQRQDVQLELESLLEDENATHQQIEEAHFAVEEAAQLEVETLSAAANKEINEDVAQAVNEMLGIESLDSELDTVAEEVSTPETI